MVQVVYWLKNRCKSFLLVTVIDDGSGGLSATIISDRFGSYRLGFFWDRGGLGSFGNEGEGLGENRKKIK